MRNSKLFKDFKEYQSYSGSCPESWETQKCGNITRTHRKLGPQHKQSTATIRVKREKCHHKAFISHDGAENELCLHVVLARWLSGNQWVFSLVCDIILLQRLHGFKRTYQALGETQIGWNTLCFTWKTKQISRCAATDKSVTQTQRWGSKAPHSEISIPHLKAWHVSPHCCLFVCC